MLFFVSLVKVIKEFGNGFEWEWLVKAIEEFRNQFSYDVLLVDCSLFFLVVFFVLENFVNNEFCTKKLFCSDMLNILVLTDSLHLFESSMKRCLPIQIISHLHRKPQQPSRIENLSQNFLIFIAQIGQMSFD